MSRRLSNANDTFIIAVVGTTGVGKSTFVAETIENYINDYPKYKVWVIDPQGTFPEIDSEQVIFPKLKLDKKGNFDLSFLNHCYNGLIVVDDMRMVSEGWTADEFKTLAMARRHRNIDMILVYHMFRDMQRSIVGHIDEYYIFQIKDNWAWAKDKVPYMIDENTFNNVLLNLDKFEYLNFKNR